MHLINNNGEELDYRPEIEIDVDEEDILRCQLSQAQNEVRALKHDFEVQLQLKDQKIQELTRALHSLMLERSRLIEKIQENENEIEQLRRLRNALTGDDNSGENAPHETINEREAKIISMLAITLNNFDKNIHEIYEDVRSLDGTVTPEDIESTLTKYQSCFQNSTTNYETRWIFRG